MTPTDQKVTAGKAERQDAEHDAATRTHRIQSMTYSELQEHSNPANWSYRQKWLITGFSCVMPFIIGLNALSISSAAGVINEEFNVSDKHFPNSYWTVTAWNVGAIFGPIIGLPLMENLGVRPIYLISFLLFFIFVIPQAVAQNYATLIVARFFAGGFGSIGQNAVANVVGDIWNEQENTYPVVLFIYSYLMGFTLGPTIGSAIVQALSWRWVFYIQLILYAPFLPLAWVFIKETRATIILSRLERKRHSEDDKEAASSSSSREKGRSFLHMLYEGTVRPVYLFLTEPVLFFFTLWSGLAVGNVFLATQSIAQTFGENYGFNDVQAGYVEGSMAVGETIGLVLSLLQGLIYFRSARKNKQCPGKPIPESRLELSIPVSFLAFAGGLFIYAWTSYSSIHWIAPTIAIGLVGVAVQVVVHAAVAYVQDAYGVYAGSAVAAVAAVENLFSGLLPLASQSLYSNLGFQWASSLLAFFALLLSFAPVVLYLKGPSIRARSKFMQSN